MLRTEQVAVVFLASALAGCAGRIDPGYPTGPTPREVLEAIRCELVEYVNNHPERFLQSGPNAKNWTIAGELEMQTTAFTQSSHGGKATLVPFSGPSPTLTFGLGLQASTKNTRSTTFKFGLEPKRSAVGKCSRITANFGIADWLASVDAAVNAPSGLTLRERSYKFGLTFGVSSQQTSSGAIDFKVIPVSVNAETLAKRDDVQVLTLALAPPQPDQVTLIRIVPGTTNGLSLEGLDQITREPIRRRAITTPPDLGRELEQKRRELLGLP